MSFPAEGLGNYVDMLMDPVDMDRYSEIIDTIKEHDFTKAERLILQEMGQSDDDAVTWSLLGLVYLLSVDVKSAGEAIQRASELAPESCLTLNLLGDFLCCNGNHEIGEAALKQSLERDPQQEFPLRMLFHQYVQRREVSSIPEVLFPLVRLRPDDEYLWQHLRILMSRMKDSHEYEGECRELTNKFADNYLAWHMYAMCLLVLERTDEAKTAVKIALGLNGNDDQTWNLYGSILSVLGRHKAAVKAQRKSILLNRENPDAWLSLSIALIRCGKRAQAKKAIDKLIALDPARATGILQYMMKGRPDIRGGNR